MNIVKNTLATIVIFLLVGASNLVTAKEMSQDQLKQLMSDRENFILLDVRTSQEFNAGHIENAHNLSLQSLQTKPIELDADENTKIIVYCRSGKRAKEAIKILEKNNFNNVDHLNGDFNGWKASNSVIVKGQ